MKVLRPLSPTDHAINDILHDIHSTPWWKVSGLKKRRILRKQLRRLRKERLRYGDPIDPESLFDAEATEDEKNAFMAALDDLDRGV